MANEFLWLSVGIRAGCDVNLASNGLLVRPEKVQALLIPTNLSQTAHLMGKKRSISNTNSLSASSMIVQDPIDTSKLTGSLERNVMVKYSSDSKILSSKMEMSVQVVEPSCDPALKVRCTVNWL